MNNNCNNKFHGVLSVSLVLLALIIGLVALINFSLTLTLIYALLILISPFTIGYFYCLKCPSRADKCPHVIFGKVTKLYKVKKEGAYKTTEIIFALLFLICAIIIAQLALIKIFPLFIIFWVIFIIAATEIKLCVCPKCNNYECPLNTKIK